MKSHAILQTHIQVFRGLFLKVAVRFCGVYFLRFLFFLFFSLTPFICTVNSAILIVIFKVTEATLLVREEQVTETGQKPE